MKFIKKLRRFSKAYNQGNKSWAEINQSVQSWIAHASHADTYCLRKNIFGKISFLRGEVSNVSGVAGRFVEQQCQQHPGSQSQQVQARQQERQ